MRLLCRCVTAGWVDFEGGDRPVAVLTDDGAHVMHGRRPARALLPPYMVASDKTSREVASLRPRSLDELLLVHGLGQSKAAKYGAGLLGVVASVTE